MASAYSKGQTLGGTAAYNFLKMPASTLLTAAGGVNVSLGTTDPGLAANNPALLRPSMHSAVQFGFSPLMEGIKSYSTTGVLYQEKWKMALSGQVYFVDYGSIPQTDASGNTSGEFRPVDFTLQLGAAKTYLQNWSYGMNIKFVHSTYGTFTSSALAFDAGLQYADTAGLLSVAVLAKNMGFQLSTFAGQTEDLPFDLQAGLTKKLAKAPFGFSLTAQHLHHFNTQYNDTSFNRDNFFSSKTSFVGKLLNHFVVAAHIYAGEHLEATLGYNHLRRSELNIGNAANGLNGFSAGVRVLFSRLQVVYARSSYQRNVSYNQLGITVLFNRLFGQRVL